MNLITLKKNVFFMSPLSFKQNLLIAKNLRNYIMGLIDNLYDTKTITCIGGESYVYALCNDKTKYIFHYTNSKYIAKDLNFNNIRYRKNIENNIIDYNIFKNIKNSNLLIINLAKLNINLLQVINKRFYPFIIIINCHHSEFWERKKYLSHYKLISRKQFISSNNFITVNLFKYNSIKQEFISLGENCSIAYQLKNLGLRVNSYPFDWSKININQLNKILENDFKDFSKLSIKKLSNNHNYKFIHNEPSFILTNPYNIIFAHELMNTTHKDTTSNLIKLEEKFKQRILRFKNLQTIQNTNITFILFNFSNSEPQLIKLINNLKKYINTFSLIYISLNSIKESKNIINIDNSMFEYNYDSKIINDIKVNHIKIYYNNIDWSDWSFAKLNWNNILFNN